MFGFFRVRVELVACKSSGEDKQQTKSFKCNVSVAETVLDYLFTCVSFPNRNKILSRIHYNDLQTLKYFKMEMRAATKD